MPRVLYISGRYRHWDAHGNLDREAMANEVRDEQAWAEIAAKAGFAWIAPLQNTVCVEGIITDREFIERDLAILGRLCPGHDMILMRPGWEGDGVLPASTGATEEHDFALERGLIVVHGIIGKERVFEYLKAIAAEDSGEDDMALLGA